jgi:hypothetical protein
MTEIKKQIWCLDYVDGKADLYEGPVKTDCQELEECDQKFHFKLKGTKKCLPITDYYQCYTCSRLDTHGRDGSKYGFFSPNRLAPGYIARWNSKEYHECAPGKDTGLKLKHVHINGEPLEKELKSRNIKFLSVTQYHNDRYTEFCRTQANFEDLETKLVYRVNIDYYEGSECVPNSFPNASTEYIENVILKIDNDRKLIKAYDLYEEGIR